MSQIHKCGQCEETFKSEKEYLNHKCEMTGFTPKDPEHLGEGFQAISEAALERGEKRKGEKEHPSKKFQKKNK